VAASPCPAAGNMRASACPQSTTGFFLGRLDPLQVVREKAGTGIHNGGALLALPPGWNRSVGAMGGVPPACSGSACQEARLLEDCAQVGFRPVVRQQRAGLGTPP